MKTWAKVSFRREGVHKYPDAEGEEEFLKYPHRHIFHVTVKIEQFHDDRDIEYIYLKRFLENEWEESQFENKSCEMIAKDIMEICENEFGQNRDIQVEVTEDGENGTLVEG